MSENIGQRRLIFFLWSISMLCFIIIFNQIKFKISSKYVLKSNQSLDIGENSDRGISDFRISGQSLIKRNCHNSWTSDDIGMKRGPETKLDKRNKTTSKKFENDTMLKNCDVISIFPICGQFGAIWKPDSGRIVWKTYIFINSNLFILQKLKTELKNLKRSLQTIALSKSTTLAKKR